VRGQGANSLRAHRGIDKSMLFYIKATCIHGYNARRFRRLPEDVSVVLFPWPCGGYASLAAVNRKGRKNGLIP